MGREGAGGARNAFRFSPRPNRAREIRWLPWGEEAFSRAAREEKPVLLSISAVWCHWCHVMDETTYSDPVVIELINRHYIPVRVDNDRDPDINRRYNQGGWPTTAFLSSRGVLLAGATYIPPETMRKALERIHVLYRENRAQLEAMPPQAGAARSAAGDIDRSLVELVGESILAAWDREHGGLGGEPKFPHLAVISFALHAHQRGRGEEFLAFATQSLRAMIQGGLRDHVEGGFFRYATSMDWSVPHYEKVLEDNAAFVPLLLRAYGATGDVLFRDVAEETADYIFRTLSDGECLFFGSQDADEDYYRLDARSREGTTPPSVDRTVYMDISARAASSFLQAGAVMGIRRYESLALAFLEFAWSHAYREGVGMAHYHDGSARRWGLLDDQVKMAIAMQQAYAQGGGDLFLHRAETLLSLIERCLWDSERGALLDSCKALSPPGITPMPPDAASAARAADALLRQSHLGGGSRWKELAGRILSSASGDSGIRGVFAAPLALAVDLYLDGPLLVRIREVDGEQRARFLAATLLSPDRRVLPLARRVENGSGGGVEVCGEDACLVHIGNVDDLAEYLGVKNGMIESARIMGPSSEEHALSREEAGGLPACRRRRAGKEDTASCRGAKEMEP